MSTLQDQHVPCSKSAAASLGSTDYLLTAWFIFLNNIQILCCWLVKSPQKTFDKSSSSTSSISANHFQLSAGMPCNKIHGTLVPFVLQFNLNKFTLVITKNLITHGDQRCMIQVLSKTGDVKCQFSWFPAMCQKQHSIQTS